MNIMNVRCGWALYHVFLCYLVLGQPKKIRVKLGQDIFGKGLSISWLPSLVCMLILTPPEPKTEARPSLYIWV